MSTPVIADSLSATPPTVELECRKICVLRCLFAVGYSIAAQFLLLALFLLFVNFSVRHPIDWITGTVSVIFSIYTWLYIMPLISLIIVYGIYLGKLYLTEWVTYKRRIVAFYKTALLRSLFVLLHVSIGFITTWFYSTFLSEDLQRLTLGADRCAETVGHASAGVCLNDRYLLLTIHGIAVAVLYYLRKFPSSASCQFELIHQRKYFKIQTQIYSILSKALLGAFLPVLASFLAYNFVGRIILRALLNNLFYASLTLNNSVKIYDLKLVFQIWILAAYIWCNLNLLNYLFEVFLAEPKQFPIEIHAPLDGNGVRGSNEVTLVEALSNTKVPILRQLAAQDLFTLASNNHTLSRRQQIYALSVPGGHPYNWNALSAQCFSLINAYNVALSTAINAVSLGETEPKPKAKLMGHTPLTFQRSFLDPITPAFSTSSPKTATEMAEKIRQRQFMESTHMRNMVSPKPQLTETIRSPSADPCARFNACVNTFGERIAAFKRAVMHIPGINYLFAVNQTAQLYSLLTPAKTQEIAWIAQGIGAIATHSLREDRFGVVQTNLPTLIHSLLRLKLTVDRIPNLNRSTAIAADTQQQSTDTQSYHNRILYIRNALKRSLYDISITFAEYLPNLIKDADDLELIQCFVQFKEA